MNFPLISPDQPFARIPTSIVNAHSTVRSLKAGDIVVSKVGTPCYASLLAEDMERSVMTRTVLGMSHIDLRVVDPYYLIAFLRSHHGFDQLMRERELTIQYQLTLDRIRKVKVYLPKRQKQKVVGDLIRRHYRCQRESVDAYNEAQGILKSQLGLDNLTFKKPVGYEASFSDLERSKRFDVEMHQRGTSGQLELYPFDIRKFLVWPAPKSLQKESRDLHDKAAAAERESKCLLEHAKTRVEELIEEAARA